MTSAIAVILGAVYAAMAGRCFKRGEWGWGGWLAFLSLVSLVVIFVDGMTQ